LVVATLFKRLLRLERERVPSVELEEVDDNVNSP